MQLTEEKLNELKELAGKATPGPWRVSSRDMFLTQVDAIPGGDVNKFALAVNGKTKTNAAFIAAASPDVVMALIERIERLEKEADWLAEMLETYGFNEEAPKPHDIKFWREAARKFVEGRNPWE